MYQMYVCNNNNNNNNSLSMWKQAYSSSKHNFDLHAKPCSFHFKTFMLHVKTIIFVIKTYSLHVKSRIYLVKTLIFHIFYLNVKCHISYIYYKHMILNEYRVGCFNTKLFDVTDKGQHLFRQKPTSKRKRHKIIKHVIWHDRIFLFDTMLDVIRIWKIT